MKFNENLKYLRKKEGLTQEQLAEKLNVSRQAVTKWESGQALPDIVNLKELAVLFGVTTDELLGDEKSKNATSLDKKLKDLPWFLFATVATIFYFIIDIQLQDFPLLLIAFVFILIPLIAFSIKAYIKSKPAIIDMRQTKEGKKARIIYILKNDIVSVSIVFIFRMIIYTIQRLRGLEIHDSIYDNVIIMILIFVFVFVVEYIDIENKVKKYNK